MKKVLHLISQLEEGGAQRLLSLILSYRSVHEMEVASLIASEPAKMMAYFRSTTIPLHSLSHSGDFYAPEILPALKKLILERKYDLVHCWLYQSIVQGALVSRSLGIPCITDPQIMRNAMEFERHRSWEKYLIKKTLQNADLVVFNSTSAAVDFLESGWARSDAIRVVRSGVDCEYFHPPSESGRALVCIGRLAPEKGYNDLTAIVTTLRKEFPDLRCLAAGTGTPMKQDAIEFMGHVEDVRSFLQKGGIYITTSHAEGLSNALLEAQACGLPAVARKIGPNSEVIEDGRTGFLCRTNEEFVEALRTLWTDKRLRKTMGANARAKIESRFSITSRVKEFELLYSELL